MNKRLLGLFAALVLLAGCGTAIPPCGSFVFNQQFFDSTIGYFTGPILTMNDTFTFQAKSCVSDCAPNVIAYIEAAKVIDLDTGTVEQPYSTFGNGSIVGLTGGNPPYNGWWINNPEIYTGNFTNPFYQPSSFGYYGAVAAAQVYQGVPATFDPSYTTTPNPNPPGQSGNNQANAEIYMSYGAYLQDGESPLPASTWFMGIDTPVCILATQACLNHTLGYEFWLFATDSNGLAGNVFNETGVDWNAPSLCAAVRQWNSQAGNSGSLAAFPSLTYLGIPSSSITSSNPCGEGN